MKKLSEDSRYMAHRLAAHIAWWTAAAWAVALTVINLAHSAGSPPTAFQRGSAILFLLLLATAVAVSTSLTRIRITKAIAEVFEAGMQAGKGRD